MRIAVAQINSTVGDFAGNAARIKQMAVQAREAGASLLVTPELALSGYPPEDLLQRDDFCDQCARELDALAASIEGISVVVGYPRRSGKARFNSAALLVNGRRAGTYDKQHLPNYRVFDEARYFTPGRTPLVFDHGGRRIAITVCEDLWFDDVAQQAKGAGAELLLSINASPYHIDKQLERHRIMRERVAATGLPLLYVHCVGGQDELVFDGASFALAPDGTVTFQAPSFSDGLFVVEWRGDQVTGDVAAVPAREEGAYRALVLSLRDYVGKNGFPGVLLGLSGGVDSALVLAIAVDALGKDRVHAVMMPSDYTASISIEDSREMVAIQGCRYSEIAIRPMFDAFRASLAGEFAGRAEDTTEENLQSRIRGTLLMAMSNKFGSIVVTTGNKSEMATGYATLYGDMAGGFAVLKDQDSLPPYEVLDAILERFMEQDQSPAAIVAAGFPEADVRKVVRLIQINEYKRRQAPVGTKITPRAFGRDWRQPITSKFRPTF